MKNDGDMGHVSKLFKLEICSPPSSFFSVDNFGRKPDGPGPGNAPPPLPF